MHVRTEDQRLAAAFVGAGGVLAVFAGFLDWADFAPAEGSATTFRGFDLSAGVGAAAFGVGLVIVAALLFVRGGRTGGRWASITALVLGSVVLIAAGYSSVAPADALTEFQDNRVAGQFGMSGEVSETIDEGLSRGAVEVTSLPGAWIAGFGGIVGLAGGIAGLVRARRIRAPHIVPGVVPEVVPSVPPPPEVP